MLNVKKKKAQSTAEYVVVLGLIVAAVLAMQTYIKRGFQGRIREAVDYVENPITGASVVTFSGNQYEPYYLYTNFASTRDSQDTEALLSAGAVKRTIDEGSFREGQQVISNVEN